MTCSPKAVAQPANGDDRIAVLRDAGHIQPIELKKTANTGVEHDHQEDRLDDRGGRARADLLAVALDQHALEAAGERDDEAEHRRLDQPDPQIGDRNDFLEALDVGQRRDSEVEPDEQCRRRTAR